MTEPRCPGQDLRYLNPEDVYEIRCPHCKKEIEFFKDEPSLRCPSCRRRVQNPKIDLGCAKWCAYAKECLGTVEDEEIASLCDRLILEMQQIFGTDQRRIDHAMKVLRYAEAIARHEEADPLVIRAAAILHDIGIPACEQKYGSTAGGLQEKESPPIARAILERLEVGTEAIEHVCKIIASHHSGKDIDTPEFRVVWDSDWLVNIPEDFADLSDEKLTALIKKVFRTERGRELSVGLLPQEEL